jgi:hypothetical protein
MRRNLAAEHWEKNRLSFQKLKGPAKGHGNVLLGQRGIIRAHKIELLDLILITIFSQT